MARVRNIGAYKVGDWAKAKVVLNRLVLTAPKVSAAMRVEAEFLRRSIQEGMWSGRFETEYRWPPLALSTKRSRRTQNPILIEMGDYVRAVRVVPMGGGVWGVGVPRAATNRKGKRLADIGLKHEYGDPETNLPARPFWRAEYAKSRQRLYGILLGVLRTQTFGLSARQVRSLRAQLGARFKPGK